MKRLLFIPLLALIIGCSSEPEGHSDWPEEFTVVFQDTTAGLFYRNDTMFVEEVQAKCKDGIILQFNGTCTYTVTYSDSLENTFGRPKDMMYDAMNSMREAFQSSLARYTPDKLFREMTLHGSYKIFRHVWDQCNSGIYAVEKDSTNRIGYFVFDKNRNPVIDHIPIHLKVGVKPKGLEMEKVCSEIDSPELNNSDCITFVMSAEGMWDFHANKTNQ